MRRGRRWRILLLVLILPTLVLPPGVGRAGVFGGPKCPDDGPITLKQAAAYVDEIDRRLFAEGTVGVKTPDVWGQNRMTVYRAEFESQMATRLGDYQNILQAAQARTDVSALTSATSLGATVAAAAPAKKPGRFAAITPSRFNYGSAGAPAFSGSFPAGTLVVNATGSPTASLTPPAPTPAGPTPPTPADPGNPDFAGMASQLAAISARLDALQAGTLALPSGINNYVTTTGKVGVGIEPTIQLDEEANYVNHLHELRRINAGDDRTDLAGYGLYLLRMPVTLMPGPESRRGKGAIVTVEARHDLTEDLLPNTIRDVAILDLTYALTQIVNEQIHQDLYTACHPAQPAATPAASASPTQPSSVATKFRKAATPGNSGGTGGEGTPFKPMPLVATPTEPAKNVAGPNPYLPQDLRLILGSIEEPLGGRYSNDEAFLKDETNYYHLVSSDRLDKLVDSVVESQRDPYPHDPSTLTLFQASILDAHRYMLANFARCELFQTQRIDQLAQLLLRRNYKQLRIERERFLWELYCYRHELDPEAAKLAPPADWVEDIRPFEILSFALLIQLINVDHQLKIDMKYMAQRRGCNCGEVEGLTFYDFDPSIEARNAFRDYVACKWPLHIYSVDPVLEQQNVLDAYSRRTELQLALAAAVATGQFNIKNATSYARRLDLDLQTVGLNRTSVGFGAGETTFGWMFYPRVQTPPTPSTLRNFANTLAGTGQGINADLKSRRIEPGQRECIALMVTPNFIPALRVSTVTNWFDVTGHHARQQLTNQEMIAYGRMLQQAKAAVARACDSGEYRPTDFVVLDQRIKQLEALLPTQDRRVDLPDEGDLLGSEIFSPNASGLSPSLLAWYGEPIQEGTAGSIFLQGRGFSVSETQVVVGGMPLHKGTEFRLISRNIMQVVVPATARAVKVQLDDDPPPDPKDAKTATATLGDLTVEGGTVDLKVDKDQHVQAKLDPKLKANLDVTINNGPASTHARGSKVDIRLGAIHARAQGTPAQDPSALAKCDRAVIDVHIATPNGISNHLYVEVRPKPKAAEPKKAVTTATTTTKVQGNTTTTTTKFETTPPGTVLPPLTVLPMGTHWPSATVLAPGPVAGAPAGSLLPGVVPTAPAAAATPLNLSTPGATPNAPPASIVTPASAATAPAATTAEAEAEADVSSAQSGVSAVPAPADAVPPAPAVPTPSPVPPAESVPPAQLPPSSDSTQGEPALTPIAPATAGPGGAALARATRPLMSVGHIPGRIANGRGRATATGPAPTGLALPPLPPDRPRPTPARGASPPKADAGPADADPPARRRIGPTLLRRIGLPEE